MMLLLGFSRRLNRRQAHFGVAICQLLLLLFKFVRYEHGRAGIELVCVVIICHVQAAIKVQLLSQVLHILIQIAVVGFDSV